MLRTSEKPLECRPDDAIAITTSPSATRCGAEQRIRLHRADGGTRDVVVVRPEQPGMLRGLAADERGAGLRAGAGDAGDDVGDALGNDLAAGDVVGHEQRLRADHDDVVDDHADQVLPDRVVLVERLGDRDLGADAIRRRRQQRTRERREERHVEEPGEAADAAENLRAVRLGDGGLHELDREVASRRVDSGFGVLVGHPFVPFPR